MTQAPSNFPRRPLFQIPTNPHEPAANWAFLCYAKGSRHAGRPGLLTGHRIQVFYLCNILEYLNMAKAHITTKTGTKITVEGTPKEVAELVAQLGEKADAPRILNRPDKKAAKRQDKQKATPINLISSLIDKAFSANPRILPRSKTALEEMGHYFPVTTLSPALLRLVRRRQLRRIKDQKRWLYTG